MQAYLINRIESGTGYVAGTGGTLRVELRNDDGSFAHLPDLSGPLLASAEYPNAAYSNPQGPEDSETSHQFNLTSNSVEAGRIYHLVWDNIDANPNANYVSVNFLYYSPGDVPAQPTMRPEDFAAFQCTDSTCLNGSSWAEIVPPTTTGSHVPIVNIVYADGKTQGLGYYQIAVRRVIGGPNGTSAVREVIDVNAASSTRTVVRVSARARRVAGTAVLRVELQNSAGQTMDQCYIPSASFPLNADTYITCPFTNAQTLLAGQRYFLVLQASAGTTYDTAGMANRAKLVSFPFGGETTFPDGHAQYKVDGGPWTEWGGTGPLWDIQFYFTLQ